MTLVANPDLPKLNMLPMTLPQVYGTYSESHSTLMRLIGEWTFSPSFRHSNFPISDGHHFKPRENNIMCITGAAGSGKTQLAARISHWLAEMGSLGGYFTFDHRPTAFPSKGEPSSSLASLLDALPLTLIHQATTVEPGLATFISDAFAKNTGAAQQTLEKRFETLFVLPVHAFVASRLPTGGAWNPLPPMVFIIDGLAQAQTGVVEAFAEWMAGKGIRALPAHVKFLILSRPEVGLEKVLRKRGAACVYEEMQPHVRWVDSHLESGRNESVAVGLDGKSPASVPSPSFKGGQF
jgi:energy-coupling factor transporter ATP-binding protein EcfA2